MKNTKTHIILFSILMAILWLPLIQEQFDIFKVKPLTGFTEKTELPELTYQSYSDGKYQIQLEKYVSENFGFRENLIRIYNQYIWAFFKKTYIHFITPGKDNWLFYEGAVKDYYGTEQYSAFSTAEKAKDYFDKNVEMMCQLRNVLKSYDIEFLSFMAPSKVYVYSEYLPRRDKDTTTINSLDYYSNALAEAGFPNIEMTSWFRSMKDTLEYTVFPKTDNHWQYTAVYGYDSLFRFMNSLNDFGIPKIKYGKPEPYYVKCHNDEASLNLLFPIINKSEDYKLNVEIECDENCKKPKVLFVGDSFIWGLNEQLPWNEIMDDVEILFYNEDVFKGFDRVHLYKNEINLLRSILRADYVVFYTSAHQWYKATYKFVEEALLALCVSDSLMQAETIRIADSLNISIDDARYKITKEPYLIKGISNVENPVIRNSHEIAIAQIANEIEEDKDWVEALKIQANIQGKSLEEIYKIEADNVLNNKTLLRDFTDVTEEMIFEVKVNELVKKWRGDKEMILFLEQKAKEKNKDFETVIYEDAKWVIEQE
ncbi:MAG: hypothetical protein IKY27_02795 [Bacteroidales bacterium]|nr:hypothetical protein [Bacteroidales bacterium]